MLIEDNNPTYDYLTNFNNEVTHKNISQKELRSIIFYYFRDDYKGKDCSEDEIDQYYDTLENALSHVHPSFCFNVDEVGYQEYSDAMEVTVLVRADYSKPTCNYSVVAQLLFMQYVPMANTLNLGLSFQEKCWKK